MCHFRLVTCTENIPFSTFERMKIREKSQAKEGGRQDSLFSALLSSCFYGTTTRCVHLHLSDPIFVIYCALRIPPSGASLLIIRWKSLRQIQLREYCIHCGQWIETVSRDDGLRL